MMAKRQDVVDLREVLEENDRLLDKRKEMLQSFRKKVLEYTADLVKIEAALALHKALNASHMERAGFCAECMAASPCPTVKALRK